MTNDRDVRRFDRSDVENLAYSTIYPSTIFPRYEIDNLDAWAVLSQGASDTSYVADFDMPSLQHRQETSDATKSSFYFGGSGGLLTSGHGAKITSTKIMSDTLLPHTVEGPSAAQWEEVKAEIRDLYLVQKRALNYVKHRPEQRGFRATERMYKSRLAAWKFSKNSTDTEYQTSAVLHKMHILAQRARINTAADQEWIMNLARHFKDRSEREKFFVTYEERDYVLGEGILDNDQEALVHPKQPNKQVATSLTRVSVPITCNGSDTNALPDTGVVLNVMSHAYALGSGLTVDTDAKKQHTFSNAKGRCFTSIGETTARIGIKDGLTPPQEVTFSIVERLPSDLILGRMFLTAAGLLKAFKDRVRRVAVPVAKEFFRVMRMDATSHRLLCQVDGNDVPAYADTGSDVDLVSLEYAIRRHWTIKRTPSHQGQVLLSDGTIEDLEGYVERTISVAGTQTTRRFHVLNGLTCDVLLGNEFIHDLDVWNNHAESLIEVEAGDSYDLYNIEWVGCFNKIEQEVEALLQAKPPPTTGRGRFGLIDRLSRKSNSGSGQQIKSALEQRLYEIDFVESRHEQLARIRISLLAGAGDTYHSEVFQDEQRRLHWTTLRAKVLDLRNRIQADRSLAPPTTV